MIGDPKEDQRTIGWNRPMLNRFKIAYEKAVNAKLDQFVFDGNTFVVGYAKYLIQYLDPLLK